MFGGFVLKLENIFLFNTIQLMRLLKERFGEIKPEKSVLTIEVYINWD
jgi:hypothetical protein